MIRQAAAVPRRLFRNKLDVQFTGKTIIKACVLGAWTGSTKLTAT
jgi:hypothetical protein